MARLNYFKSAIVLLISFCLAPLIVQSANILFYFQAANFSQKNSIWPLVIALAEKGHNVTFLSPQTKSTSSHPNLHDLAPQVLQDMLAPLYKYDRFVEREASREKQFDYVSATIAMCKNVLHAKTTDPTLAKLFSPETKFDLVIVNSLLSECGFYIAKHFNAKTIHYTPGTFVPFFYETYGISTEAAWIPDFVYKFENIPMTFWDRAYNALLPLYWQWVRNSQMSPVFEQLAKTYLEMDNAPALYQLENQVGLVLLNSHASADFARTMPPFLVDVGGMTMWEKEKEIPQQFKDFLNTTESKSDGVVLITFGSTVLLNTIPSRHQAMFFHLIKSFPNIKFLMRWKGKLHDFVDDTPKNLMVSDWLPQREILSHPNLKAFITHGGISSIHEATYYGVPMIALPLFSDQDYNSYRLEAQEVGLRVEIRGMSGEILVDALNKVLSDKKFKDNMLKKSAIFKDRAQSPLDTALFWTEFVLRHNDTIDSLRPPNQHLNSFQIRLMDVHLLDCIAVLVSTLIVVKISKKFVNRIVEM